MTEFNPSRRSLLLGGAAAAAGLSAMSADQLFGFARAWAQTVPWKSEAGAKINLLRRKRFVEAEDQAFMAMIQAFTKATGVEVNVSNESYDDIQPKASVAANTGQGLDMVWGLYSLPHLFPEKCQIWLMSPPISVASMVAGRRRRKPTPRPAPNGSAFRWRPPVR